MPIEPVTAIGLGLSAASLLSKLLGGDSAEEERQRRRALLITRIAEARKKALVEGTQQIVRQTQATSAASRQAAARRAAAAGQTADQESYILPAEGAALEAGGRALEGFTTATNREFDRAELGAEMEFADRPIAPDFTDIIGEIGAGALQYGQDQEYLDIMRKGAQIQTGRVPEVKSLTGQGATANSTQAGGGSILDADPSESDFARRYRAVSQRKGRW